MALSCSKKIICFSTLNNIKKGDFYCLNWRRSLRTRNKLKSHEKVRKNKDNCGIVMPREKDNLLESNQYMKSDKMPYIIYADIKSSIKKADGWANDSEKSLTTKICEHIRCRYSMSTTWSFGNIENKHT